MTVVADRAGMVEPAGMGGMGLKVQRQNGARCGRSDVSVEVVQVEAATVEVAEEAATVATDRTAVR